MCVMVRWIGWDVELERTDHEEEVADWDNEDDDEEDDEVDGDDIKTKKVQVNALGKEPIDGPSRSIMYNTLSFKLDHYGLTKDGQAISVDTYCV